MLIVSIIFFTSGICFATNVVPSTRASVTSPASTKSKRVVVDPDSNIRNNQEQPRDTQTTPRAPPPQDISLRSSPRYGNAKSTDTPRVSYISQNPGSGPYAYGSVPKRPFTYVSSPVRQIKPEQSRGNLLTPYFGILNNLDAYKTPRSIEKPLDAPKSIVSQSLQKLQGIYSPAYNAFHQGKPIELSSFSNFESYPSYASIGKLISQGVQNDAPSTIVPYKMSYPLPKISDYAHVYAPSIPTVASVTPASDKTTQGLKQKDEVTVDVNGKKISVPIVQLQSNLDFSGVFPAFDSQPFLLSSNYPIESDMGFKFGTGPKFNMALQSNNVSPFSSPLSSFQGQVVPIHTANGSPQFPLYKGASIEAYPIATNVPKAQGNYESLYSQPQLHFDKEGNVQPVHARQNAISPPVSTQGILNDVELINKKNPEPHTPQPDEDDDEDEKDDERYRGPEKEYEHSFEEDEDERQPGKYFKAPQTESDFKPSTSYPFKHYKNYASDNDEEEEDSSSEYRSEYAESSKPSHDSYEEDEEEDDEEEEESRKQEKRKDISDSFSEPKRSKYYQKDFEQEFEDSYKEELPKQEYVHVKEVPEIESHISPSSKRQQKKNNQSHVKHAKPIELKNQELRTSQKSRKVPKTDYKDSTAYGSDVSIKKTGKMIYEEFFGYKKPKATKYSKHGKSEKVLPTEKLLKDDYPHTAKYYKFKGSKTDSELDSNDKDPYVFANNQKSNKNLQEQTITNVRQLSDTNEGSPLYGISMLRSQVRSLTNAEILRDLTGI
ncbi:hypothetical protein PUN28_011820 [Cardiocondyla obscurior]|uniref:Uncharacterized protein n=1 Tax=Cardiocondyla obscurior TaxID=286306 RepID=A0AAW2FG03_9HYME